MKKKFNKRGFPESLVKLMRIMRITFFLVFASILTLSASSYSQSQRLSLNMENATVEDVIEAIEQQSEFIFFYQDQVIDLKREVDISVKNAKIKTVMDQLLKGTSDDYMIDDRQIIIAKGKIQLLNMKEAIVKGDKSKQKQKTIKGKVTDTNGEPLVGVTVVVEGTTTGAATDVDGNYSFKLPKDATALVFTFIGMTPQSVDIGSRLIIDVVMEANAAELDEVIKIGYGSQRKRDVTGAISSVAKELVAQRSTASAVDALQGTVAGLQFSRGSGEVGDNSATIRIRGTSTLSSGAGPLYVVDGVEVSGIGNINPDDIASMEILKDAASASIYGSRSANGVILVTTKKGTIGKPKIRASYTYSLNSVAYDPPISNLAEWREWDNARTNAVYHKKRKNKVKADPADSLSPWYNTDYYHPDAFIEQGYRHRASLNISNATKKFNYYINVDAIQEKQAMASGMFKQLNARMNFGYKVSNKLSAKNNFSLSYGNIEGPSIGGAFNSMLRWYPGQTQFNQDGNLNAGTPLARLLYTVNSRHNYSIMEQMSLNYKILKNLTFETRANVVMKYFKGNTFENVMVRGYRRGVPRPNRGSEKWSFNVSTAWDNFVTYNPFLGKNHNLSIMVGSNVRASNRSTIGISGDLFPTDAIITMGAAGLILPRGTSSQQTKRSNVAFFGRAFYDYKKRYLLTATYRIDGSSNFGMNNRWADFSSFSGAWRFSNEKIFKGIQHILTDGKIRASWGVTGNTPNGTAHMSLYRSNFVYGGDPGVGASSLGNPYLSWEETAQTNFGIDLTLFGGQLSIVADYYNKQTDKLLYGRELPATTGFSHITNNIGKIENKGWELSITEHAFRKRAIKWDVTVSLAKNKNKLIELADHKAFYTGRDKIFYFREGHALNTFYGWKAIGIYSYDEDNSYTEDWQKLTPIIDQGDDNDPWKYTVLGYELNGEAYTGTIKKKKTKGFVMGGGDVIWEERPDEDGKVDGVINNDDKQDLGSALPDIYGGIYNRFTYKSFTLSVLFSFQFGNDAYGFNFRRFRDGYQWGSSTPHPEHLSWYWNHPGQEAKYPLGNKYWNKAGNNRPQSSLWVQDASYIQLSNIRLDYRLPRAFAKKINVGGVSLFAIVDNVAMWTNYKAGLDPSVIGGGGSIDRMGIDVVAAPQMRKISFGLNVNF
jgi:TonB-linked SusC/RagA family outer membrane protein